eukprot:1207005-Alexandrium_andersonii.AAC.1
MRPPAGGPEHCVLEHFDACGLAAWIAVSSGQQIWAKQPRTWHLRSNSPPLRTQARTAPPTTKNNRTERRGRDIPAETLLPS